MVSISFDAMGGDNAPDEIVKGALLAVRELGIKALIVGEKEAIIKILKENSADFSKDNFEIIESGSVI